MFKFVHDAQSRTVYRYPAGPNIRETVGGRGRVKKRTGWDVDMWIDITRADNRLVLNQWEHKIGEVPTQSFDSRYDREQAISYFLMHHAPRGAEITESEYERLQAEYEAEARSRP
jgi:hypothetical protein